LHTTILSLFVFQDRDWIPSTSWQPELKDSRCYHSGGWY